jgi:hypothetical protein
MVGPDEFAQVRGTGRQGRPARRPTGGSTSQHTAPSLDLGEGATTAEQSAPAWEAAYRHYGHVWEMTARSPKGDPAAAREMAAASRAVAAAWRQIDTTTLPWWTVAALESAAAAFEEQAQKYDTDQDSTNRNYGRGRQSRTAGTGHPGTTHARSKT